ncbi:MAG: hypothetical protein ABFD52_05035 [Acidobacteriota bacterium]
MANAKNIPPDGPLRVDKIPRFVSQDIYLSAFLLSRGAKLVSSSTVNGRVSWTFEAMNVEALVFAFNNNAAVPVMDFISRMRTLRSMTRSARP